MAPRWKLLVEGLGKIEHAEVEVRPLMLFVGENNSGKSYLASTLWGLLAMQSELTPPAGPALDACKAWLSANVPEGETAGSRELRPDELNLFVALFEAALEAGSARLVERVFNSKLVGVRKLDFHNISTERRARIEWVTSTTSGKHTISLHDGAGGGSIKTTVTAKGIDALRDGFQDLLMRRLVFGRLTRLFTDFEDTFSHIDPIYLPASRTGFMQLYKGTVRQSHKRSIFESEGEERLLDLTRPAFHFIDMLAFGLKETHGSKYADEADMLEASLKGKVEIIVGSGINDFRYSPEGAPAPLPMSLSSSLVTEIAPIILVLRHLSSFPVLILEEPEAHLHPKLQRRLAQVIVRLIRKGLYVWITTHSENFCQQINNFMKLGALDPSRRAEAHQKLGYGEQDYLDVDDVSGYQFKLDETGERSTVTELKKTGHGMVMPTFNKELIELGREIDLLDQQATE